MSINITERYKLIFAEHQFASDFRLKILRLWGLVYAALVAVFGWIYSQWPAIGVIVLLLGAPATLLMWIVDFRNRSAINGSHDIGAEIEKKPDADIPKKQRYFARLVPKPIIICNKIELTHSLAIDVFSIIMILAFPSVAAVLLFLNMGVIPKEFFPFDIFFIAVFLQFSFITVYLFLKNTDIKTLLITPVST